MNRISNAKIGLLFALILISSMVAVTSGYYNEYPGRRGPKIDKIRFKVIKSPDATLIAMQTCVVDIAPDLIRTGDVEKFDRDGFTITSTPGFHMGHVGINIRVDQSYKVAAGTNPTIGPILSDVNFRHALLHAYNQEEIVASIYKYIVTPVRSLVPPALGGWVNPEIPSHPYSPGDPSLDSNELVTVTGEYVGHADGIKRVFALDHGSIWAGSALVYFGIVPVPVGWTIEGSHLIFVAPPPFCTDIYIDYQYFVNRFPNEKTSCGILREGGYLWLGCEWLAPFDLDGDGQPGTLPGSNPATGFQPTDCTQREHGHYTKDQIITANDLDDVIPPISLWTPTYEVAPTSAEHGARFVADCNAICIPIVHYPREFSPYLEDVFGAGDFDMYMVFWGLTRFADHLYDMCHSSQDCQLYTWRYNGPGIHDPDLDAAVETVKFSLDHDAKLEAAYDAQYMLYDVHAEKSAFSYLQLYSRILFNAFKPGIKGIVNEPGYGSDNLWTFLNMYWEEGHPNERIEDFDPGPEEDLKSVIIYCLGEEPERMNPCYAHTVYAWEIMGTATAEGLIDINPYTLADEKGLADDWLIEDYTGLTAGSDPGIPIVDGMRITFYLNDTVVWQDGLPYTAEDAAFNWLFMRDNQIPRYTAGWEHIASVEVTVSGQGGTVRVYLDITSQFLIYDLAGMAAVLPPPVWERWDGEDLNLILGYDPSVNTTKPATAGPWFGDGVQGHPTTQLYGTGPFVFEFYDQTGMYGEVHQFIDYWKYTVELSAAKTEMFHKIGDVDRDGEIGIFDLSRQGVAFGAIQGLDPEYDPDADLNSDGIIDMRDIALTSFYYGDYKEYPES